MTSHDDEITRESPIDSLDGALDGGPSEDFPEFYSVDEESAQDIPRDSGDEESQCHRDSTQVVRNASCDEEDHTRVERNASPSGDKETKISVREDADQGCRCTCSPHVDAWTIASQIFVVLGLLLSCLTYCTFLISLVGLVLFEFFWCIHRAAILKGRLSYCPSMTAGITSVLLIVNFVVKRKLEAAYALVSASFWAASAFCMFYYVKRGRYARRRNDDHRHHNGERDDAETEESEFYRKARELVKMCSVGQSSTAKTAKQWGSSQTLESERNAPEDV